MRIAIQIVSCLLIAVTAHTVRADPLNIVFILIDDLGWSDVGPFGETFAETPNLDRLAATGMRFTNGYAANPVCSPTRASIMTGRNPARLQLTNFLKGRRQPRNASVLTAEYADYLPLDELTIAEALKSRGYHTCFVGKWHLGPNEQFWPQHQGFDINIAGCQSGMPRSFFWPQWTGNPPIEGEAEGQYLPDLLSQRAVTFIEDHAKRRREEPFFLYLAHYTVHIPIHAKAEIIQKYEQKRQRVSSDRPDDFYNVHYGAMVESMDESVGRVLDALDRLELADNTVVAFFSDNGGLSTPEGRHTPATDNHPLRAGKGHLYEGGIREPMLVRVPGVTAPGSVCDHPVISDDWFPTLCELAGVDVKDNDQVKPAGPLDGASFAKLLRDPDAKLDRDALFWHYPHFSNQGGRPGAAVRMGDWKLIEWYETGDVELYNLREDVSETADLAAKQPERAAAMLKRLRGWRAEVNANMPKPNPDYRAD